MARSHRKTRVGDEYQCSCGLTWDVHEDDPHAGADVLLKVDLSKRKTQNKPKYYSTPSPGYFDKLRAILGKNNDKN